MKKIWIVVLCILLLFMLAGCKTGEDGAGQNEGASYTNGEICGAPGVKG